MPFFLAKKNSKKLCTPTPPTQLLCRCVRCDQGRRASCAVVASQWAGGAVRENEVLFSVFFVEELTPPYAHTVCTNQHSTLVVDSMSLQQRQCSTRYWYVKLEWLLVTACIASSTTATPCVAPTVTTHARQESALYN